MLLSQKVKETVKLPSPTMRAREARVLCFRSVLHSFIINSYVILDVVHDVAVGGRVRRWPERRICVFIDPATN